MIAARFLHTWLPWRSGLARIIAARGEVASAVKLVEQELADARILDSAYSIAYALRTLSAVAPTDQRVELLDEALGVLIGAGAARLGHRSVPTWRLAAAAPA